MILLVVSPVLHRLPVGALDVNTVEPPKQNEALPEIVGVAGVTQDGVNLRTRQP